MEMKDKIVVRGELALVLAVVFYQRVSAKKDSGPAVTA